MTPVPPYFFIVVVCLEIGRVQLLTTSTTAKTSTSASVSTSTVSAVCQDDPTVNCTKYKPQCSDFHYNDLMNKYCPKTCDKCEPATTCQDAADHCEAWNANGFCNSTYSSTEQKKAYCEKTCGFCS
ncbi:hypothetical protein RB195_002222 [Necator americanus]|uniref:ShKT domain-containing protein n=1 Tax=Necator americanus TaxID=51031 RepID=A0ABR1DIH1_NECAM